MLILATPNNIETIYEILHLAVEQLSDANIPQWQNPEYPSLEDIQEDIRLHAGFLYRTDAGVHVGYAMLKTSVEATYSRIFDGAWAEGESTIEYATIHRFAIHTRYTGKHYGKKFLLKLIEKAVELGFSDIRIDTHEKNRKMIHLIENCGFTKVGKIIVEDGTERIAFQLIMT